MLWLFLGHLLLTQPVHSSDGDQDPQFVECVRQCIRPETCAKRPPISWDLWLMQWSCLDLCRYDCMHAAMSMRLSRDLPVQQYYGKWPFERFMGLQEPASVLFSFGNLWVHYRSWHRLKRILPPHRTMRTLILGVCWVQINAWWWSMVFHSRDLPWTERMDYFSAMGVLVYGLYLAMYRTLSMSRWSRRISWLLASLLVVFYLGHVLYLSSRPRFDYGYHMKVNLTIAFLHHGLWMVWAWRQGLQLTSVRWCVGCTIFITFALGLEVLDFPPWWGWFDAHSLWHLATIFVAPCWYYFLELDSLR